jgi:hypothetical protein
MSASPLLSDLAVAANDFSEVPTKRDEQGWHIIVSFQNTLTGRFRSLRFIARYFLSRLRLYSQSPSRATI